MHRSARRRRAAQLARVNVPCLAHITSREYNERNIQSRAAENRQLLFARCAHSSTLDIQAQVAQRRRVRPAAPARARARATVAEPRQPALAPSHYLASLAPTYWQVRALARDRLAKVKCAHPKQRFPRISVSASRTGSSM